MKPIMKLNADDKIQRAIISLLRTDPLYADYLLRWPRIAVARGTMAVNGREMIYNPAFVEAQNETGLRFILKHEVGHVIMKHPLREVGYSAAEMMKSERMSPDELRDAMNVAGDLEINSILCSGKDAADMPDHGILPGRGYYEKHPANENMEVHFDIIRSNWKPPEPEPPNSTEPNPEGVEQQDGDGDADSDGDDGPQDDAGTPDEPGGDNPAGDGDGEPTNDPSGNGDGSGDGSPDSQLSDDGTGGCGEFLPDPEVETEAEAQAASQEYDQTFLGAAMAAQEQGKLPGWAKELAEAICAPAKIPWQVLLRRWARKSVRGGESTYSRPSRRTAYRTDIVLPSKRSQSIRRCLFIVDTSGSMGTNEVNAAVPEMLKIMQTWKRAELVLVQCDSAVGSESVYKPGTGFRELQSFARSPQWNGRGGTDMDPAFALIGKYRPEVVVCVTDGYMSWPSQDEAHGLPVLWLMVNELQVPPWGERIVLEVQP